MNDVMDVTIDDDENHDDIQELEDIKDSFEKDSEILDQTIEHLENISDILDTAGNIMELTKEEKAAGREQFNSFVTIGQDNLKNLADLEQNIDMYQKQIQEAHRHLKKVMRNSNYPDVLKKELKQQIKKDMVPIEKGMMQMKRMLHTLKQIQNNPIDPSKVIPPI